MEFSVQTDFRGSPGGYPRTFILIPDGKLLATI